MKSLNSYARCCVPYHDAYPCWMIYVYCCCCCSDDGGDGVHLWLHHSIALRSCRHFARVHSVRHIKGEKWYEMKQTNTMNNKVSDWNTDSWATIHFSYSQTNFEIIYGNTFNNIFEPIRSYAMLCIDTHNGVNKMSGFNFNRKRKSLATCAIECGHM